MAEAYLPVVQVSDSPSSETIDLSGSGRGHLSEKVIGAILFICGAISILTTIGIVFILVEQAAVFFGDVGVWEFISGTKWTPLFKNQESFGVLALVSATLMIGLLSMLIAIPFGLMSAIYMSEYA